MVTNRKFSDRGEMASAESEFEDPFEGLGDEMLRSLWREGEESGAPIEVDFSRLKAEARHQQKT